MLLLLLLLLLDGLLPGGCCCRRRARLLPLLPLLPSLLLPLLLGGLGGLCCRLELQHLAHGTCHVTVRLALARRPLWAKSGSLQAAARHAAAAAAAAAVGGGAKQRRRLLVGMHTPPWYCERSLSSARQVRRACGERLVRSFPPAHLRPALQQLCLLLHLPATARSVASSHFRPFACIERSVRAEVSLHTSSSSKEGYAARERERPAEMSSSRGRRRRLRHALRPAGLGWAGPQATSCANIPPWLTCSKQNQQNCPFNALVIMC